MFLEQVHTGKNQWYLYVFSLLIIFTATQIGSLPLAGYLIMENPDALTTGNFSVALTTNTALALTLLSFVAGFFAIFLCVKHVHRKTTLSIVTSRRKVDRGRIFFAAGIWSLLTVATLLVSVVAGDASNIVCQFDPLHFFVLVIISLLLFPFQTSFEELLFRGYLMQWAAYLFRYRWIAVLLTGVLFGIMHVANPEIKAFGLWVALPQYVLMGLVLSYVTVKDDGMELALGLHLANNILAAVTLTSDASALQTHALFKDLHPAASWTDLLVMLVSGAVFIWACNRKYRFMGKVNLREKIQSL